MNDPVKPLVDDLADVLVHMVVGWEDTLGVDLAKHPEVVRVMARYREHRTLVEQAARATAHVEEVDRDRAQP